MCVNLYLRKSSHAWYFHASLNLQLMKLLHQFQPRFLLGTILLSPNDPDLHVLITTEEIQNQNSFTCIYLVFSVGKSSFSYQ